MTADTPHPGSWTCKLLWSSWIAAMLWIHAAVVSVWIKWLWKNNGSMDRTSFDWLLLHCFSTHTLCVIKSWCIHTLVFSVYMRAEKRPACPVAMQMPVWWYRLLFWGQAHTPTCLSWWACLRLSRKHVICLCFSVWLEGRVFVYGGEEEDGLLFSIQDNSFLQEHRWCCLVCMCFYGLC